MHQALRVHSAGRHIEVTMLLNTEQKDMVCLCSMAQAGGENNFMYNSAS
jgi:hypothetical protein